MASEFAPPLQQFAQHDDMETSLKEPPASQEGPQVNGNLEPTEHNLRVEDSSPQVVDTATVITKEVTPVAPDLNSAGPTPIEAVSSGIAGVAGFIPKDASNLSHPTPPPDEPLMSGASDVDIEMANDESEPHPAAGSEMVLQPEHDSAPAPVLEPPTIPEPPPVIEQAPEPESFIAHLEQSLVRPREDDAEDEPAAKRSKVEEEPQVSAITSETIVHDAPDGGVVSEQTISAIAEPVVESSTEATPAAEPEQASQPASMPASEPAVASPPIESAAEDVKMETPVQEEEPSDIKMEDSMQVSDVKIDSAVTEAQPADAPAELVESMEAAAPITETPIEEKTVEEQLASVDDSQIEPDLPPAGAALSETPKWFTEPMTRAQKVFLSEKIKNLKKTKSSGPFLRPVDYVTLGIPSYPEVIKNPMDLGTMDQKLKEGKYPTVQEFIDDFDRIINNVRTFNGEAHAVTQMGRSMEAYFRRVIVPAVPGPDQAIPKKDRSPSIAKEKPARQPSMRAAAQPPPAPAPPPIQRQSSISERPARAIKPPQNREIAYAKPKRKEHQTALRFCEHVLDEIRSPKYGNVNHVFQVPVDPVALNIPNYFQVIKSPMDLSTMSQKLKSGQYGTADEFKRDFDLMIKNCLSFNPNGNPVRDLGIQLQRTFEGLWAEKSRWEKKHQPASPRASSASVDDDSAADDEDEDADDEVDDQTAQIRALQQQLDAMRNALEGLGGDKAVKSKKPSSKSKPSVKKASGSVSAVSKPKPAPKAPAKPKKVRMVTYEEKQEISEAVGNMNEKQVAKLTEIITQNCAKYRDMEEMELEIDDLPNDVQIMLLEYVRRIFGNPNKKKVREASPDDAAALDDDDYEERGAARGGSNKRKKHKPMGKQEQQDTIKNLQNKLAQFSQAATSGSESPTNSSFNAANAQAESSGDDEESSEEE